MRKNLYFTFVMLIELAIIAAFIWFLIYLFPTMDPQGYLFYGDAPHAPYLDQELSSTVITEAAHTHATRTIMRIRYLSDTTYLLFALDCDLLDTHLSYGFQSRHTAPSIARRQGRCNERKPDRAYDQTFAPLAKTHGFWYNCMLFSCKPDLMAQLNVRKG